MTLDQLKDLYRKRSEINARILKLEQTRREGRSVTSIDELACKAHPDARFVVNGRIPNSEHHTSETRDGLNTYICAACKDDFPPNMVQAYDCPVCGVVVGEYAIRVHDSIGPLPGSMGYDYHCRECDLRLGHHHWKFS